jgi:hypothetical protein
MKDMCINLAKAESEIEVIALLKKAGFWDDPKAWQYYGGNENNFATIGNQQSRPEAALVEKIINSVDALLMAECYRRGNDPTAPEAPQTIYQALEEYYGIVEGKLTNIGATQRTHLAENIYLVATGMKTSPCYSIIDKGEGQTPKKMPDTLLSLAKSNKLRIPFVQGKFNMGGTGVFQFCGDYNIQLIISRRHPEIANHENDPTKDKWGFTVIRRENPQYGVRSSTYRYLAPNNSIISFNGGSLPLIPGEYPNPYDKPLEWGTFIKLYNYQMTGLKTNILFDLNYRLALFMPQIALPIRLCERRKGYSGHTFETTLAGLTVRLDEDRSKNLEPNFPKSSTLKVQGQKMSASIFAFKRDQESNYKKDEGIIFTINGQTHGRITKDFFSRGSVKLGYLANSVLVIVDCSGFDGRSREDLFMNSRDRLRAGDLRSEIEKSLEEMLRNDELLRELANRRRREEVENKLKDDKPLADLIEKLIKKSPTLTNLFLHGTRISSAWDLDATGHAPDFKGKKFPTYFTPIQKYPQDNPKNCHINMRFRLQFKTDADNDYFDRSNDKGELSLKINSLESKSYSCSLSNGTANLFATLPEDVKVGDTLHVECTVIDCSRLEPFYNEFYIHILDKMQPSNGSHTKSKREASGKNGNSEKDVAHFDIPTPLEIKKDDWPKYNFNEDSALKVTETVDGTYDFFINIDNKYLLSEQKYQKIDPKLLKARYSYGMVLVGLAILHESKNHSESDQLGNNTERDISGYVYDVTKALSPVLLPMIGGLSELVIEETEN